MYFFVVGLGATLYAVDELGAWPCGYWIAYLVAARPLPLRRSRARLLVVPSHLSVLAVDVMKVAVAWSTLSMCDSGPGIHLASDVLVDSPAKSRNRVLDA